MYEPPPIRVQTNKTCFRPILEPEIINCQSRKRGRVLHLLERNGLQKQAAAFVMAFESLNDDGSATPCFAPGTTSARTSAHGQTMHRQSVCEGPVYLA